ncbi:CHAT domain-containing protein [Acrocarpospora corrugata]|uniref:CHAT domain-containing protein n=1 Tax=Acrocarpospora corrugata TaxID=35763 RepID=A0A5M3W5C6_9ACTN|nr:CHAT domain-containing protein [Acrocarpospora corrugata]GES03956.1 CHAT domain-containing protein [Acrocarpospora corrugata]
MGRSAAEALTVLVMRLLEADSWGESFELVARHPEELLHEDALFVLDVMVPFIQQFGPANGLSQLARHRRFLELCARSRAGHPESWPSSPATLVEIVRELDHGEAIAAEDLEDDHDAGEAIAAEYSEDEPLGSARRILEMVTLLERLADTPTLAAAEQLIKANPRLLDDPMAGVHLTETADLAARMGRPEEPAHLRDLVALLARLRGEPEKHSEATASRPPETPGHFHELWDNAVAADERAKTGLHGWPGAIDAAAAWESMIERPDFVGTDPEFQGLVLSSAGVAYLRVDWIENDATALDGAIRCWARLVEMAFGRQPWAEGYPANLAALFMQRYQRYGRHLEDLKAAIREYERLRDADLLDDPRRMGAYAATLSERASRLGRADDLTTAIDWHRRAIAKASATDPRGQAELQRDLATSLIRRFEETGALADLDDAIAAGRAAVAGGELGQERLSCLGSLATALSTRFERYGDLADLDEAITFGREALDSLAEQPAGLTDVMEPIVDHLEAAGLPAELIAQLKTQAPPTEGLPPHERAGLLSNLGTDLTRRFRITANVADIDEAITRQRAAVDITPHDHPDRMRCLTGLSQAHLTRYRHAAERDLPTAVNAAYAARNAAYTIRDATPGDHPSPHVVEQTLHHALLTQYEFSGRQAHLEAAREQARRMVGATAETHPDRGQYLLHLGNVLDLPRRRAVQLNPAWEQEARDKWLEAAGSTVTPPLIRAYARRLLGEDLVRSGDLRAASGHFEKAMELLPEVVWRGLSQATRERQLSSWNGLATDAAACAIAHGDLQRALELLEQGRSVLWSQQLDIRTDLTALKAKAPDLAARLQRLHAGLDSAAVNGADTDRRIADAREWETTIAEVQALPGFDTFLRPAPFAEFARVPGPVIVLNVSTIRCDAMLVRDGEVSSLPLPITYDRILTLANDHLTYLEQANGRLDTGRWPLLDELWRDIAEPCLSALGVTSAGRERVWWCPTGPLAFLPLHAAGDDHDSVLDRTVPSYTTTLTALTRAAKAARPAPEFRRLLCVGVRKSPGTPPLVYAVREASEVAAKVPGTTLLNADATRAGLLAELPRHAWVHLACHGGQDPWNPSDGALYLADGQVRMPEIAGLRLKNAEFAFLSACRTAAGGYALPDESLHLTAALQQAGFRHVTGSLWPVGDLASLELSEPMYTVLADGGFDASRAAHALHEAVLQLRAAHRKRPFIWAPYVHFGP